MTAGGGCCLVGLLASRAGGRELEGWALLRHRKLAEMVGEGVATGQGGDPSCDPGTGQLIQDRVRTPGGRRQQRPRKIWEADGRTGRDGEGREPSAHIPGSEETPEGVQRTTTRRSRGSEDTNITAMGLGCGALKAG